MSRNNPSPIEIVFLIVALGLGLAARAGLVICQPNGRPNDPDGFSKGFVVVWSAWGFHPSVSTTLGLRTQPWRSRRVCMWKVVSERLGHSSIALTLDTHSHAIPAMQEAAAEQIAALFATDR